MSVKRRLQSRAQTEHSALAAPGPSSRTASSASNSAANGIKYQHPARFPLQPKERRQLGSLVATYNSENSQARRYIADALRVLGDAAGDLAELVPAVDFTAKKEEETQDRGGVAEGEEMEKVGRKLLIEMESKAREMVDIGWEAGVAAEVIRGRVVKMAEQDTVGEEEEEQFGLWEVYEEEIGELVKKRLRMPLKERYGTVAEYKEFRRSIWETQHQGEPMPPTKHWFPPETRQKHQPTSTSASASTPRPTSATPEPDDDSDLEIESAKQSFNCPITLRPFTHPVTSSACPHSFEKVAIGPMLAQATTYRNVGSDEKPPRESREHPALSAAVLTARVHKGELERCIHCPAAGCDKWLSGRHLKEDRVLMRRIRIERERREREEVLRGMGEGSGGDGRAEQSFVAVGDESMVDAPGEAGEVKAEGRNVKNEKARAARILDIDSDDEDEDA
ncbi:zinc-finger of the MIZ type in Nse subunit-domain-containing protein [Tirmania nivea]|nr:zinc-finger of the MIZ type in Nse subunit-domain-containing protein [Tirmania nivea]